MGSPPSLRDERISLPPAEVEGLLRVPAGAVGIVVFAHGSGSSRLSPRNRAVARALRDARLATLLFDLLTEAEAEDRRNVFDVALLASRLVAAMDHLAGRPDTASLPIGLFGSSTGAAAALRAAAERTRSVRAVVSRGGRPDLAGTEALARVAAPTLLIVGGKDREVLAMNRTAAASMSCPVTIEVVPGATHLFEEPGALEEVAQLAAGWFRHWLFG